MYQTPVQRPERIQIRLELSDSHLRDQDTAREPLPDWQARLNPMPIWVRYSDRRLRLVPGSSQ